MTTLAVSMVSEEIEKITSHGGGEEIDCKTVSGSLVALSNNNIQASLAKHCSSSDSGTSTSEEDNFGNTMDHQSEESNSNSTPSASNSPAKSSQDQSELSKCSQESKKSSCSTSSSRSSVSSRSESTPSKQSDEESHASSSSTLKGSVNNDDEDSRSSVSSSSTVKSSQSVGKKTDDDSNSKSSFRSHSQRSSPSKKTDSESTQKTNQSLSQLTNDESDDEKHSKSSCTQSSRRTSPARSDHSDEISQTPHSDSTSTHTSQSTVQDSSQRSISKSSQSVVSEVSDLKESRPSSRSSSANSTPSKPVGAARVASKKHLSIVDSDSDEEIYSAKSKLSALPSHSDTEQSAIDQSSNVEKAVKSKTTKRMKIIDSDSDEGSVKSNKSLNRPDSKGSSDDSDGEVSKPLQKSNKFSTLIDSDSESDNQIRHNKASSEEENDTKKVAKGKKKTERKRTGTARASKDLAMQQIRSETQRLVRESNISLPYHRPKQRTLEEFLNRKKIVIDVPKNLTVAERVRMFPEMISKIVEEKEKEADEFYKSSDSEDEDAEEPMEVDQSKTELNENGIQDKIGIETDQIASDQIQSSDKICNEEALDKKSPHRSPASAVSRKLFMDDVDDLETQIDQNSDNASIDKDKFSEKEGVASAASKECENTESQMENSDEPCESLTNESENTAMEGENITCNTSESREETQEGIQDVARPEVAKQIGEHKDSIEFNTEELELKLTETETDSYKDRESTTLNENNDESQQVNNDGVTSAKEDSDDTIKLRLEESPKKSSTDANSSTSLGEQKTPLKSPDSQNGQEDLRSDNAPSTIKLDENGKDTTEFREQSGDKCDEDPILKLANQIDDEKILDYNALRSDFGVAPEFDDDDDDWTEKINFKNKILADVSNIKPMIRGAPGSIIDFNSTNEIKEGASRLIDRFVRHSLARKSKSSKVAEVKIVRTEGAGDDVQIVEEVLPFKREAVEEDDPKKDRKPGERMVKLREELKNKIAQVRTEEWKQREQNQNDEEEENVKCKDDDFYAGLPDEEEELEDEESAESEPEEDDVPIVENRKAKSKFVDEEAEESMDEEGEDADFVQRNEDDELSEMEFDEKEEEEDEEKGNEEEEEDDDGDEDETEDDEEDQESEKEQAEAKPKVLRRIIRPADDDSDDSDTETKNDKIPEVHKEQNQELERSKTEEDMFASQRPQADCVNEDTNADGTQFFDRDRYETDSRSQNCKTPAPRSNFLSLISPVAHLTALNASIDSATKSGSKNGLVLSDSAGKTPIDGSAKLPPTSCSWDKLLSLPKKLFDDPPETVNDDEILEICSGKFTDTQDSLKPPSDASQSGVTDSQILGLCSGAFGSQPVDLKALEANEVTDSQILGVCSGAFSSQPVNMKALERNEATDSQIMGLCSGAFGSQPIDMKALESNNSSPRMADENSQDITLTLDDDDANSKLSPVKLSPKGKGKNEASTSGVDISQSLMKDWIDKSPEKSQKQNQVTDSQLLDICSGAFLSQPLNMKDLEKGSQFRLSTFNQSSDASLGEKDKFSQNQRQLKAKEVTDSQILAVCSGSFVSQPVNLQELEKELSPVKLPTIKSRLDSWLGTSPAQQDDQEIEDTILLNSDAESFKLTSNASSRNLLKENSQTSEALASKKESEGMKGPAETRPVMKIVSSSDEEENKSEAPKRKKKALKKKKKKVQKLSLSDDEDEDLNEYSDEEESDVEDDDDEEKYIDYDSDENEIVVSKKDIKKVANKFVEKEAELSESEWGSADEDERDLDKFEVEEGDADEIDENKVKDQLDKIHMKQVMDEDQREVRMLQELLFDDGDLHSDGAGRERKFKWKNIDNVNVELGPRNEDDETLFDDDIDADHEVQMRKLRYEQQKFLEEKEKKAKGMADDLTDSEVFKLGLKIVNARSTFKSAMVEKSVDKSNTNTSNIVKPNGVTNIVRKTVMTSKNMSFGNARGSFLARGEATLVRISQHLPESNKMKVNAAKAQKFVFAHLSPSVPKEESKKNSDGTENDSTPKEKKRKRKIFSSQTPTSTKKLKVNDGLTGKKLF